MTQRAEDLLRQVRVVNAHSSILPKAQRKLELAPIELPEITPAGQHLEAWIEECNQVLRTIQLRKEKSDHFDSWYSELCNRMQPPGMSESRVLSPSKKQGRGG